MLLDQGHIAGLIVNCQIVKPHVIIVPEDEVSWIKESEIVQIIRVHQTQYC